MNQFNTNLNHHQHFLLNGEHWMDVPSERMGGPTMSAVPEGYEVDTAVREMVRVITQPGGTVAATMWDSRGGLPHVRLALDIAAALDEGASEYRFYDGPGVRPGAVAQMWHTSGLRDVEEGTLVLRMEFPVVL